MIAGDSAWFLGPIVILLITGPLKKKNLETIINFMKFTSRNVFLLSIDCVV